MTIGAALDTCLTHMPLVANTTITNMLAGVTAAAKVDTAIAISTAATPCAADAQIAAVNTLAAPEEEEDAAA